MTALCDEVDTPGTATTDTGASIAIELTRASLDAGARTSAATEVTRLSAISVHDLQPDLHAVHPGWGPRRRRVWVQSHGRPESSGARAA